VRLNPALDKCWERLNSALLFFGHYSHISSGQQMIFVERISFIRALSCAKKLLAKKGRKGDCNFAKSQAFSPP